EFRRVLFRSQPVRSLTSFCPTALPHSRFHLCYTSCFHLYIILQRPAFSYSRNTGMCIFIIKISCTVYMFSVHISKLFDQKYYLASVLSNGVITWPSCNDRKMHAAMNSMR